MSKYSFLDDYSEGCHPNILKALSEPNLEQQIAYGEDEYSHEAKALIHKHLQNPKSSIFFVAGGTLANLIIIAAALRPHEAVISAHSGHIALHETGAIEAVGHKIISVPSKDGKLTPTDIETVLEEYSLAPHMAKPKLVYISNVAETGRIYIKSELEALSKTCREHELILLMDGARLSAALSASKNDLTLKDIAALTDVFWLGGTKAGALIGEAIIINRPELAEDFAFHIKQRGALLAKGRLLGLQFRELFRTDLYFEGSKHANELAQKISKAIVKKGFKLASETQANQIFPILPNSLIKTLEQSFQFYDWEKADEEHRVLRLVTSWATDTKQVETFIRALSQSTKS